MKPTTLAVIMVLCLVASVSVVPGAEGSMRSRCRSGNGMGGLGPLLQGLLLTNLLRPGALAPAPVPAPPAPAAGR